MSYNEEDQMAYEDAVFSPSKGTRISFDSPKMLVSDNDMNFARIAKQVNPNTKLNLTLKFTSKLPYYEFADENRKRMLFLTQSVLEHTAHWLEQGTAKAENVEFFDIEPVEDEQEYILRRIKYDRDRGVARRNKNTDEYKALYPFGTINYGILPYRSVEELVEKLNQLR